MAVFAVVVAGLPAVSAPAGNTAAAVKKAPVAPKRGAHPTGKIDLPKAGTQPTLGARTEVTSMRSATSNTYAVKGSGGYQTVISPTAVNYQDAKGAWQPIDTTLVADTTAGFAWKEKAADYSVQFPKTLADGPVQVTRAGKTVAFALTGAAKSTGTVDGSSITYADVLPGVSVTYTAMPQGVKESLTLADAKATRTFPYQVTTSAGLTTTLKNGQLDVTDSAGKTAFSVPAPFVQDGSPEAKTRDDLSGHAAVTSSLAAAGATPNAAGAAGAKTLTETVAPAWLGAAGRVFPATVDPSVVFGPNQDCSVADSTAYANTSYCASGYMDLGYGATSGTTTAHRRDLLYFVTSSIPSRAVVLNADLALTEETSTSGSLSFPVQTFGVTQSWLNSATWNNSGTGTWSGGTWDTTQAYDIHNVTGTVGSVFHSYPTKLVQSWVDGSATNNYGLLLKPQTETSTTGVVQFASSDYTPTPSARPTLTVAWQDQLGEHSDNTFAASTKLDDQCDAKVNAGNGNLIFRCLEGTIPGVAGSPMNIYRYYNSGTAQGVQNNSSATLGLNRWNLSTGIYLEYHPNGWTYYDGEGTPWQFDYVNGVFVTPPGLDATFSSAGTGQWKIVFHQSNVTYLFKQAVTGSIDYQLLTATDGNGNVVTSNYLADGRLNYIQDSRGRKLTAQYVTTGSYGPYISELDDDGLILDGFPSCCSVYSYTGYNLTTSYDATYTPSYYSYADFGGTATQELSQFTDPLGHTTEFTYDANGRVLTMVQHPSSGVNYTTGFAYYDTASPPTVKMTDPRGKITTYTPEFRDFAARIIQTSDPLGHTNQTSWNPDAQPLTTTNGRTGLTTNTYDSTNERLTQTAAPTGFINTQGYAAAGACTGSGGNTYQPLCSTNAETRTTNYAYDTKYNRTSATNAAAAIAKVTYNTTAGSGKLGTVATSQDPNLNTTTYNYATAVTFNGVTTYQLSSITPPSGNSLSARSFTFDGLDRLHTLTNGNGVTATYAYDEVNRVTGITYSDTTPSVSTPTT